MLENKPLSGRAPLYTAYDPQLGRKVELHVRVLNDALDAGERARRLADARRLAELDHPHTARILDAGVDGGLIFIAAEQAVGKPLPAWLAERPRSATEIVSVFAQVGEALQAIRARGVVDRAVFADQIVVGDRVRLSLLGAGSPPASGGAEALDRSFAGLLAEALARSSGGAAAMPDWLRALLGEMPASPPRFHALVSELRRRAAPRGRGWSAVAVVTGLALLALDVSRDASVGPPACVQARVQLRRSWDDQRARLRAAFASGAASAWPQAERLLDEHAVGIATVLDTACRAEREVSLERTLRCLDARRGERDALINLLLERPDTRPVAARAALELAPPSACARAGAGASLVRTEVEDRLSRARALRLAGSFQSALQEADAALLKARRLGRPDLEAAALVEKAHLDNWTQPDGVTMQSYQDAAVAAYAAGDDALAAASFGDLAELESRFDHHALADRWLGYARAAADRAQGGPELEAQLALREGMVLSHTDRSAEALERFRAGLRLLQGEPGSVLALGIRLQMVDTLTDLGELDEARREAIALLAEQRRLFGEQSAVVMNNLLQLGEIAVQQAEPARALPYLEEAQAMAERTFGPDGLETFLSLLDHAEALADLGRHDEALALHRRALRLAERRAEIEDVASSLFGIGDDLVDTRPAEAIPFLERALEVYRAADPPDPTRGEALLALSRALARSTGDLRRAGGLAAAAEAILARRVETAGHPRPRDRAVLARARAWAASLAARRAR